MKKIFMLFLLLFLILSELTVSASADTLISASDYYTFDETGVGFIIPEGWTQVPSTYKYATAQFKSPYNADEIILFNAYDMLSDSVLLKQFFDRNKYIDNSATNTEEIKSAFIQSEKFDQVDVKETRIGHVDYYEIRLKTDRGGAAYSVMFVRIFYGWCYGYTFVSNSPINTSPGYADIVKLVSDSVYPYSNSNDENEVVTRNQSTTIAPATDTLPADSATMPTDSQEQNKTYFNLTSAVFGMLITVFVLGASFAVYLIIVRKKTRLPSKELQKFKNRTEIVFFLRSCQELSKEEHVILDSFEYISNELFTIANLSSKKDKRRVSILENELRTLTSGVRFNELLKRTQFSKRYVTDIESALFSSVYLIKAADDIHKSHKEPKPTPAFSESFMPDIRSEELHPRTQHTAPEPNATVSQNNEAPRCRKCGVQLKPDSLFCHKCGESVIGQHAIKNN